MKNTAPETGGKGRGRCPDKDGEGGRCWYIQCTIVYTVFLEIYPHLVTEGSSIQGGKVDVL